MLGEKSISTTTYHPQSNGQSEKLNRTILSALRKYVGEHPKDWDLYAESVTYAYNNSVHQAIDCKPFDLVISRKPSSKLMEYAPVASESVKDERVR